LANTHRLGAQHGQSTVDPQSIDRFLDPPLSTTVVESILTLPAA
jgi:hypothetical protein